MDSDKTAVSEKIWTVPNVLSMFRLLLVVVFAVAFVLDRPVISITVFVLSGVTDFLDGWIARKFQQISKLGQILDPLADRVFIVLSLVLAGFKEVLPWWFVVAILARDVVMVFIMLALGSRGFRVLPVNFIGKAGTAAIYFSIPILLLSFYFQHMQSVFWVVGWASALWGVALYWIAGIIYIVSAWKTMRSKE
ncbi:MAG: CDP-alcohol phosphatidyltransferase family protein [Bifidobacteriaceae bacterium]|jgi:cardiolipin synthase|nr:CDP-alcohol phosphatidyltransferase family protein [Bifidobacteriaceae bacterium]